MDEDRPLASAVQTGENLTAFDLDAIPSQVEDPAEAVDNRTMEVRLADKVCWPDQTHVETHLTIEWFQSQNWKARLSAYSSLEKIVKDSPADGVGYGKCLLFYATTRLFANYSQRYSELLTLNGDWQQ